MFGFLKKSPSVNNIEAAEMKKMITKPKHKVIDVRTAGEFSSGHIKGAININVQNMSFKKRIKELNPEQTYLVYCRSGKRSSFACRIMANNGIENVLNLRGGIMNWPYKVEK